METFLQCVQNFENNSELFVQNDKSTKIYEYNKAQSSFDEYVKNNGNFMISDWVDAQNSPKEFVFPSYIKYGDITIKKSSFFPEAKTLPLLLPTFVNAVLFNFGQKREFVPNIFKNIILRLLLTMRMDTLKISIVNGDFGASYKQISMISNPSFNCKIVDHKSIANLIEELSQEISYVNTNLLGNYEDIDKRNSAEYTKPYHIVVIDDFPDIFTKQNIEDLVRIVDKANACKAGIKIFINYSQNNDEDKLPAIQNLLRICSSINYSPNGFSLSNWKQNYIEPEFSIDIETSFTERHKEYVEFLNTVKDNDDSLDRWIEDQISRELVWTGDTSDGIKIPIGFVSPQKTFDFYLANDNDSFCNDYFALIAGLPGYGKTTMLHNIIINAAIKYSPEDLIMYLADFKEGAGFDRYKELPHVQSLMLTNDKEYALSMLQHLVAEAKHRAQLYRNASRQYEQPVNNLSEYRRVTKESLPRILFIMDEFHYLFQSLDATTTAAKEALCNGIRQWRQFGINIILSTQSISDVNFGDSTNKLITYRIALSLLSQDSKAVILNEDAQQLTEKGQAIMNNSGGIVERNVRFRSTVSKNYNAYVKYLKNLYSSKYSNKKHTISICEAGATTYIADNPVLMPLIVNDSFNVNNQCCTVYVGRPSLLRIEHTKLQYRQQQNSNTIILGDDYRTLIRTVMVQLVQLYKQSSRNSKFYIIDLSHVGNSYEGMFNNMPQALSDSFIVGRSTNPIGEIYEEYERRKRQQQNGNSVESRIVVTIVDIQNSYELRSSASIFSDQNSIQKQLSELIADGSSLGIHFIIHGLTYKIVFEQSGILNSRLFTSFENRIFLKGADIKNAVFNSHIDSIDEEGQMFVGNGNGYEHCYAYCDISHNNVDNQNSTIEYMSQLFTELNNINN